MSDRPDIPREEIEALMVFLSNDTLAESEREAVESAIAKDSQLQTELEVLRSMRTKMKNEMPQTTPGEFGLMRLMREIDKEPQQHAQAAPANSRFWKIATAAVVALFAIQSVVILTNPRYNIELAGGGNDRQSGPALLVAFSEGATEGDIRALLLELDLVIVDGPSALGLYTLAAKDDAARGVALTRLKGAQSLIDSVELED